MVGLVVVFRHFYDYWPEEECGVVGTIGKGIFGSVLLLLLVEGRNTGSIFVMKGISKEYMLKKKEQVKHTVQCMRGE